MPLQRPQRHPSPQPQTQTHYHPTRHARVLPPPEPTSRGGGCFSCHCCCCSSDSDILDEIEREQQENRQANKLKRESASTKKGKESSERKTSITSARPSQSGRVSRSGQQMEGVNTRPISWTGDANVGVNANAGGDEGWKNMVENRPRRSRSWSGEFDEAGRPDRRPTISVEMPQAQPYDGYDYPQTTSPTTVSYQPGPQEPMSLPYRIPTLERFDSPIPRPSTSSSVPIPLSLRPGAAPSPIQRTFSISNPTLVSSSTVTDTPGFNPYAGYNPALPATSMPAYPAPSHTPPRAQSHSHLRGKFGSRDGTAELHSDEAGDLGIPANVYLGDVGAPVRYNPVQSPPPQIPWELERRYSRDGSEIGIVVDEKRLLGA